MAQFNSCRRRMQHALPLFPELAGVWKFEISISHDQNQLIAVWSSWKPAEYTYGNILQRAAGREQFLVLPLHFFAWLCAHLQQSVTAVYTLLVMGARDFLLCIVSFMWRFLYVWVVTVRDTRLEDAPVALIEWISVRLYRWWEATRETIAIVGMIWTRCFTAHAR